MISFLGENSQTDFPLIQSDPILISAFSEADSSTKIQQQWSSLQTF